MIKTRTRRERHVWFPVDENGEPDLKNPDDGLGGFIHHLETVTYYFVTSDGKLPNSDGSNILEGSAARKKAKENKVGKDWQKTFDLIYREFETPLEKGGCDGKWEHLEEKLSQLEEPDFCLIGQFWRQRHGGKKRTEEEEIEKQEQERKRKKINKQIQIIKKVHASQPQPLSKDKIVKLLDEIKSQIQKKSTKKNPRKFLPNPPKTPPSRNQPRKKYKEFPRRVKH